MARVFLRVYFSSEAWLGPGKIQLLDAIDKGGSIRAGAAALGMSYRRAWLLVDAVNRLFRTPAVQTALGGRGGGTAVLTPLGREVVRRYRAMQRAADRAAAPHIRALAR